MLYKEKQILKNGHNDSINCLTTSILNNNLVLLSGGDDCSLIFWSLDASSSPTHKIKTCDPCTFLKFSEDNPYKLFATCGSNLIAYDCRNFSVPLVTKVVSEEEINSLDILENEDTIMISDDLGLIKVLDLKTFAEVCSLQKHENICSSVLFQRNYSDQVISGGLDCKVIVSSWKNGQTVSTFEMSKLSSFSHEDALLYASDDNSDTVNGSCNSSITSEDSEESECEDDVSVNSQADMPSRRRYRFPTFLSNDDELFVRAASTAWSVHQLPINPPMVHSLLTTNDGSVIAAALNSSTVELFDGQKKIPVHMDTLYGHSSAVSAMHLVEDKYLISGGNDKAIFVWNIEPEGAGFQYPFDEKVNALAGNDLHCVCVGDLRSDIRVLDMARS